MGVNFVEGSVGAPRNTGTDSTTPKWAPAWMPEKRTLDYVIALASFTFLALGSLYFLGINVRPVRVAVQAKQGLGV